MAAEGRDLLAGGKDVLASSVSAGRDLLASDEPSTLEAAGAGARGLVKGALGFPGAVESMFTEEAKTPELRGYETVFPTPSNVGTALSKVGWKEPREAAQPYQTGGEIVGGFAAPVYGAGKATAPIVKEGVTIARRAKGVPLKEAVGGLETSAEELARKTAAGIERGETVGRKTLAEQSVLRQKAMRDIGRQLETGATRAKEESATALNAIAKPGDEYQLGERIREKVVGRESQLKDAADKAAEKLKSDYFKEGKDKEKARQYWAQSQTGQEFLKYLKSVQDPRNAGVYTQWEINAARDLTDMLASKKVKGEIVRSQIEKIEKVIRDVKKLPSQPTATGADALKQQYMGKLAQKLEDSVYGYVDEAGAAREGFAPTGRVFRDVYRQMMQPLNTYESPVGKVITGQLEGVRGIFTADATAIPGQVFKSPQQIRTLEAMGVEKKTLEPFASQHTSNVLSRFQTAEQAQNWLKSADASYLREFPDLAKKAESYVNTFAKNEATVAEKLGTKKTLGKMTVDVAQKARREADELSKMATEDKTAIGKYVFDINNAKNPTAAATAGRNYIKFLKDRGFLSEQEAVQQLEAVRRVETEIVDRQRAITALKGILPYAGAIAGAGAVAGYSLNKLIGGL